MGNKIILDQNTIINIIIDSKKKSIRNLSEKYLLNKNVIIRVLNQHEDINTFNNFIKKLRLKFNKKIIFNGLTQYLFKGGNINIFFIQNEIFIKNDKIKPILLSKINDRYENTIFIYEDEWYFKKQIIIKKIELILGVSKLPKIYARKCTIKHVNNKDKKIFLNNNHIQGTANATIIIGGYYNNKLVAIMTFLKHRNMTKDKNYFDYELNRFATDINYHVIGIGGKLFNYFLNSIEKNTTIVSYGDKRHVLNVKNNLYKKLNFKLNQISKYDYFYIKKNSIERQNKITMQIKYNNSKYKNNYKSESDYYEKHDYKKIWDCGKYRFTYRHE